MSKEILYKAKKLRSNSPPSRGREVKVFIMKRVKIRTYSDKLLENRDFKEKFDLEYRNLVISEKIAQIRHKARLTQEQLAKKISTTKSAISRYESNAYNGYSVSLLSKIALACNTDLRISFVPRK